MDPRDRYTAILSVVAAAVVLVLANSIWQWKQAARAGWTGATFDVAVHSRDKGERRVVLLIKHVEPRSPAALAGLRRGERIVALEGSADTLVERFRSLGVGRELSITAENLDGAARDLSLRLAAPLAQAPVLAGIAANLAMGLLSIGIGSFVYWRRPDDIRALVFFAVTSIFGLARLISTGLTHTMPLRLEANFVPIVLYGACVLVFFPALLHFCLVFPKRRAVLNRNPRLLRWIYGIPFVVALGLIAVLALALSVIRDGGSIFERLREVAGTLSWPEPRLEIAIELMLLAGVGLCFRYLAPRWRRDFQQNGRRAILNAPGRTAITLVLIPLAAALLFRLLLLAVGKSSGLPLVVLGIGFAVLLILPPALMWFVFPVAACVALYRSYRESGPEEKRQVRWPMFGVILGVTGFAFTGVLIGILRWSLGVSPNSVADSVFYSLSEHLPQAALLLIPVSIACAVLKYRLMDIDIYVRRTVIYGTLTILLALLYVGAVGGLGALVTRWAGGEGPWTPIGSTLMLAILFVPLRNRVQELVDRRLYRHVDYPAALRALSARLAAANVPAQVFRAAVETVQVGTHARTVALWLRTEGTTQFSVAAKIGTADALLGSLSIPGGSAFFRSLDRTGSPRWIDLPEREVAVLNAVEAVYAVPIRGDQGLLGFLTLGRRLSDEEYGRESVHFLDSIAVQIATKLENLSLRQQQEEFEKAREIQLAMLPRALPQPLGISISGAWQSSQSVGGDYYDVLDLGDGAVAVVIADVSGKGMPAALLMSNLQAAVKVLSLDQRSPAALCERLNRVLMQNVTLGKFVTLFYGVLDARTRTFIACNAGHNPPILHRAGGEIMRLDQGGPLLGVLPAPRFQEQKLELLPGDRLLLFTDGLSEAFNEAGEDFGEERLAGILGACEGCDAQAMRDRLLTAVSEFCQDRFQDDVTLLVLAVGQTSPLSASSGG